MRRLVTVLVLLVSTTALLTFVPFSEAVAKTSSCANGTSSKAMGGMDMGHGKKSMEQNCPTVAGARKIAVTGNDFSFSPKQITIAAGEDVTIALTAGDIAHDFYVKGIGHVVHAKAGKTASKEIRIEQIRALGDFMNISTHRRGRRVLLLHPAEALNPVSSNALAHV